MKKLILLGNALLLSLGMAYSQGFSTTGVHDDFASTEQYSNGPNGEGVYWFDLTNGNTLALNRPGGGVMELTATSAGGCSTCYPVFGVQFGSDNGTPYLLDLSGGADITFDIENTTDDFFFMSITLEDVNGKKAEYEPNVSDLSPSSTWDDPERKSLNGFSIDGKGRHTITIDLSSVAGAIGGLSLNGTHDCDPGPYNCPPTSYQIDPSKIKAILFTVNLGKSNIFISEGDDDYTMDTFLEGADIEPFNGVVKIYDFKVGNFVTTSVNKAIVEGSLAAYPNPAKDILTVSFKTNEAANVSLSDIIGNKINNTYVSAGENTIIMNTSALSSGIYFLNIAAENGVITRKVVIE